MSWVAGDLFANRSTSVPHSLSIVIVVFNALGLILPVQEKSFETFKSRKQKIKKEKEKQQQKLRTKFVKPMSSANPQIVDQKIICASCVLGLGAAVTSKPCSFEVRCGHGFESICSHFCIFLADSALTTYLMFKFNHT